MIQPVRALRRTHERGRAQDAQPSEEQAEDEEVAEDAVHGADRHVHESAVWFRDEKAATQQGARSLVTKDDQQRQPLGSRLPASSRARDSV
jgi:hypothetical protein